MQEWSQLEIEEAVNGQETALIYLYTPMCGTCQMAGKMLTVTEQLLPDQKIGKADLNYMPQLAEQWGVESVPCLLIFKEGNLQEKLYAFRSVPYLLDRIRSIY
ncbi:MULTISPECIES: thioredoxin family protein [Bacillaceae]|jgi:thioredoxin-like negative regulator of GroEL|uniref:thioredoxin family protein n=1 Tax=Bacillaceae TaxID=186817 RepID=UPI001C21BD73|nr:MULTISPECIES: thioredoxin family protein [Bacillaceae]MBU8771000.1 thioredoxin family protein [Cytobacillus oceanisediminis]MBY0159100.1 thioredoxin family protein [Cytobacillus firmus]MCM3393558.1 thioredoxin family protein [Cytobacillus oceanisediminis]MCM3529287.1 thioredoxin family protein [Cytobacillus oceanisediminis]MCS0673224.1 thioredoxin family protein [Cytobacillus firmus]